MQALPIKNEDKQKQKNTISRNLKMIEGNYADGDYDKQCSHTQAETEHDNYYHQSKKAYDHDHECSMGINLRKENRTQTTAVETPHQQIASTFKEMRQQCLELIRLSSMVQGASCMECSPQKCLKKLKKSVVATNEQLQSPVLTITKQSLKSPLKIDMKKLQFPFASPATNKKKSSEYFNELSEELFLFNPVGKRWERSHMQVESEKKQLIVNSFHVPLMTIEKVKIYKPKKEEGMREVKVTYTAGSEAANLFMNIGQGKSVKKVPLNYSIFQQILTQKLVNQNTSKQTKWTKQPHICEQVIDQSYIFGEIYKKSQYLGKWEKRYIVLNGEGVFSYRSALKKEDCSFTIQRKSIDYLWTRFDMIDNFLIIKIKHGIKQTQFGIPVTNYSNPHFKNWLYYFYKLMETD